jgi:quinolinate synthase
MNSNASCRYMKMITPAKVVTALREGRDEVDVPCDVAERARRAVERMVEIGSPARGGE